MEQKDLKLSGYRQLEQLRQEYESLPVPLEARDRILAGIAQGKKETDKAQMKGVIFMKLMKRTGMTAAAAMVAITLLTNLHPTIANAMEQIPVIGPIAKVVTFRTYENKTNNFEANIQIPQIEAAPETLNKSIEEYANDLRGFYLDIHKDLPGDIYTNEDELLAAVKQDAYDETAYQAFYERFCSCEDGKAAKRVIDIVFHKE